MRLIAVDTVLQHLETGARLHASCRCGRADWLDLAGLVEFGFGEVRTADLGKRLRCRVCGSNAIEVQRHGPPLPSERACELERLAAERSEKVRPFRRREPPRR